jgi:hypothetical protein
VVPIPRMMVYKKTHVSPVLIESESSLLSCEETIMMKKIKPMIPTMKIQIV